MSNKRKFYSRRISSKVLRLWFQERGISKRGYARNSLMTRKLLLSIRRGWKSSGLTIEITGVIPFFYPEVYIVALKNNEERFRREPTGREILRFIRRNKEILSHPGFYLGCWLHEGIFFLDISIQILGKSAALEFGRLQQQMAIYHPFIDREIFIRQAA